MNSPTSTSHRLSGPSLLASPPEPSSAATRIRMQANRSRDTGPELALRRELHARGLRYRVGAAPEPDLRCHADVVFRPQRIAVFVDGCFWHRCPLHATDPTNHAAYWQAKFERVVARDRKNDAALTHAGWTVVRVWEHDDPAEAADYVEALVRDSGRRRSDVKPHNFSGSPLRSQRSRHIRQDST